MQRHRLTPEQAYFIREWDEINNHAWRFRKKTGDALRLAIQSVDVRLRKEVADRIELLQRKHGRNK